MLLSRQIRKDMKKKYWRKFLKTITRWEFFPNERKQNFYCNVLLAESKYVSHWRIFWKLKWTLGIVKKKDSEISHFEIQVGVCQFPKNVLNEGSEHLEIYELQKSISHLTSHLIIITAVIFFLLWQVTWAHFSIFICAWQFATQWDEILSEGAFHAIVFFDDIYETYHDS